MQCITSDMLASLILAHQFVTPSTCGSGRKDLVNIVRLVGGLQWGAEDLSLLSRINHVESSWIREAVEKKELLEVHVLRGGLRIIPSEEYPYYFAGTREVIERIYDRRLVTLKKMTDDHRSIIELLSREGRLPLKEIRRKTNLPNTRHLVNQLLIDGKLIRASRKKNQVLIDTLENWLPGMILEDICLEEARLWMAKKFLSVYGPSTESELAHWAGWTVTRGREVMKQLSEEEATEEVIL
ncbi:MAG: winged helix DNA-binding domain-containing protein, partial [Theionarchaea archaeon]|nr:winged helix DNA-binding domain-containing protein [Theionarchaea archaeon]